LPATVITRVTRTLVRAGVLFEPPDFIARLAALVPRPIIAPFDGSAATAEGKVVTVAAQAVLLASIKHIVTVLGR
jgi:hypothetical protein